MKNCKIVFRNAQMGILDQRFYAKEQLTSKKPILDKFIKLQERFECVQII